MTKPIAIHDCPLSFSDRWIEYCREKAVDYRIVDCYSSDIIDRLRSHSALLWHWGLREPHSFLIARSVITAAEKMGLLVYPNSDTAWHYDDKLAQKYLLEAIGAPLIKTEVFFNLHGAESWIGKAEFPLVFKLRNGSASSNVRLVRSRGEALGLCRKAFSRGFNSIPGYLYDRDKKIKTVRDWSDFSRKLKRLPGALKKISQTRNLLPREKGYIYFQEFIPGVSNDIRITVIGKRAFAYTRSVRPNDFRASGSGLNSYDQERIPRECIKVAFKITEEIHAQSLACDFIQDKDKNIHLTEVSYGFPRQHIADAPGYWDDDLIWRDNRIAAEDAIIEDMINSLEN